MKTPNNYQKALYKGFIVDTEQHLKQENLGAWMQRETQHLLLENCF